MDKMQEAREWLDGVRDQGAQRLELRAKNDGARVRSWSKLPTTPEERDRMAVQILRAAERDGLAQPAARVTYIVFAFAGDAFGENYLDRFWVEVAGANPESTAPPEYSADLTGLVSQQMRMVGEVHGLLLRTQDGRIESYERTIESLTKRLESHDQRFVQVLALYEKVTGLQLEREQVREHAKLEQKRMDAIGNTLHMVFPIALNRLLGGSEGKGTPYTGETLVRNLLGSLTAEQIDTIVRQGGWTFEQQMLLSELYRSYAPTSKRPLNGQGDPATAPEGDAAGTSPKESTPS